MARPSLPVETTTEIIRLATEDLIEQERLQTHPTPSPVNDFLLAASSSHRLGARSPNSRSSRTASSHRVGRPNFQQLDTRGMAATLVSARFGAGGRSAGAAAQNDLDNGEALVGLVDHLPVLEKLELIGGGLVFPRR